MKSKRFSVKKLGRRSGVVREYITIVDEEDAHYLRSSYWLVSSYKAPDGKINDYVMRNTTRGVEYLHHVVCGEVEGKIIFHINGNSLDNRKENLLREENRVVELAD